MIMQDVIDEVKLELTGYVLDIEIEDETIAQVVHKVLRELERYWDETTLITVPFCSCIDLSGFDESAVVNVYRNVGTGNATGEGMNDPMYAQQWMVFSNGGTMYNLNDYALNFAAWSTLQSIKNTLSTDLTFKEDKHNHKLYINNYSSVPKCVTIEYIPKLKHPDDIKSDYWIDIMLRMTTAMTKIILGRIRTRFTPNSALYAQDGDKMLEEGNSDLKELREILRVNSNLTYGLD